MQKVILIGFMGSGKSTLGKKLANRMKMKFIDLDSEIEQAMEMSVGDIFAQHGESYFRELESRFIDSLFEEDQFVLATGGGTPCFGQNMDTLSKLGLTIYLERSPKELTQRLKNAKQQRPLLEGLTDGELLGFIEKKLAEREEAYRKATLVLSREEQTVEKMEEIIRLLRPD